MRRLLSSSFIALLVVVSVASGARADYRPLDPSDVPWMLDIRRAASDITRAKDELALSALFFDEMEWWKRPTVHFLLDTRRTSKADYVVSWFWKNLGPNEKYHCTVSRLTPSGAQPAPRILVISWGLSNKDRHPGGIDCSLDRTFNFRSDGTPIRWRVVAYLAEHPERKDYAPARGSWFPHL